MGRHRHTTLFLTEDQRKRLEIIARKLGCLQTRGAGAGKLGSISALARGIAIGELRVISAAGSTSKVSGGPSKVDGTQVGEGEVRSRTPAEQLRKGGKDVNSAYD